MLYIIPTPIGNLKDITYHAVEILSSCDYILSENPKKSSILLNHYKIKKRILPFHKFNEKKMEEKILRDLKDGKSISLISSAGTPLINDPGSSLVAACIKENIKLQALPGACSVITALLLSGFSTSNFQFIGFLEKKGRKKELQKMLNYIGTTIFFESPERILDTLETLNKLSPDLQVTLLRELTKKFEEVLRGDPKSLIDHFLQKKPKGEFIVIFSIKNPTFDDIELEDLLKLLRSVLGLSSKDAIKMAAKLKDVNKKLIYKKTIQKKLS